MTKNGNVIWLSVNIFYLVQLLNFKKAVKWIKSNEVYLPTKKTYLLIYLFS